MDNPRPRGRGGTKKGSGSGGRGGGGRGRGESGSARGRGGGRGGPPVILSNAPLPWGVCRNYWQTGTCRFELSCEQSCVD